MSLPQLFAINPELKIEVVQLSTGDKVVMVDDFLKDPQAVRALAVDNADAFLAEEGAYPGVVWPVDNLLLEPIHRFVKFELSRIFSICRADIEHQFQYSITTLQPENFAWIQRLCHTDPKLAGGRRNFASLVYLFDDPELGGTGFYRYREPEFWQEISERMQANPDEIEPRLKERYALFRESPKYMTGSNEVTELLDDAPAKFNRFLFYSGSVPHSAFIKHPERLSPDPAIGRLTLNGFSSVVPKG